VTITAAHIRELSSLGITGEVLIRVIEIIEDASLLTSRDGRDAKAKSALRSKAYRDRKREGLSVTSDVTEVTPPLPSSSSPTPPLITTLPETSLRSVSPERARVIATWPATAFEIFWRAYPRKVGRKSVFKILNAIRLRGEVEFPKLLNAVILYAANTDPNFFAHASTWLNRGSWDDEIKPRDYFNGKNNGHHEKLGYSGLAAQIRQRNAERENGGPPTAEPDADDFLPFR
jgi:hypothetical protein